MRLCNFTLTALSTPPPHRLLCRDYSQKGEQSCEKGKNLQLRNASVGVESFFFLSRHKRKLFTFHFSVKCWQVGHPMCVCVCVWQTVFMDSLLTVSRFMMGYFSSVWLCLSSLAELLGEGSRALTSLPVGAPHKHSIVCENVHGLRGLCTSGSCY